ncbi:MULTISPECIES: 4-hydroxy-tetrahydrodipicolinate synthase [unclassified Serratia (in: enterobacteria)]|uniref:4-hydroxy-tetrahydrodipicolinate synthase n=1 Tax=unclassified Serratia (in: enterobacteria) TaxID=2647522 RepID=UPI0030762719
MDQFNGSIPALVTPLENGKLNTTILNNLIDWHVEQGSSALVICGTTGESPTLSHQEQIEIIAHAVKMARERLPIIAGTGSNCTAEAIHLSVSAQNAGASGILHATGYYNKPTQSQVIEHFRALDEMVSLPIIIYNIPSRTGQELQVETIAALSELRHVCGIKDSTGNVARVTQERRVISKQFSFLSGDDSTSLGYVAHGGHGCISVTANVIPGLFARMIKAALQGDFATACKIQDRMMPLHEALFLEPSPGGIKYAMSRRGLCPNELRGPLTPVTPAAQIAIDKALRLVDE